MDKRVTPPKRVTSPTWVPPPPCKLAHVIGRNRPLEVVYFVFPIEVPGGDLDPLSFHKLCVDMHVSKTKFEKKKFSRVTVLSRDLYWENKTYKLKRSTGIVRMRVFAGLPAKKTLIRKIFDYLYV